MTKSSRCRRGAIRTKSQVPQGARLSGSESKMVSGVGTLVLGIPRLPSFTFSLTTCVEPSCLDTGDAALVLTPIGWPVFRGQSVSPGPPYTGLRRG